MIHQMEFPLSVCVFRMLSHEFLQFAIPDKSQDHWDQEKAQSYDTPRLRL